MHFLHIEGSENPTDILTKFLPWSIAHGFVETLLFWHGDVTGDNVAPSKEGSDKQ
jgi:hypothetical protein